MRDEFSEELFKLASKDKNLIFITADLGYGVFNKFASHFPNQYLNVGVAEQNMIGIATGLGLEGKRVFVYSIANFTILRCLEQIRNDAAYHDVNLTLVSSGGGFTYGPLGMSHHATEDIAIMRSIPGINVIVPSSAWESRLATRELGKKKGINYLRIEKGGEKNPPYKKSKFKIGQATYHINGSDITIIAAGGIIEECILASKYFNQKGLSVAVLSMHTIKPIDRKSIIEAAKNTKALITVEEHNEIGGLGSAVSEVISTESLNCNFKMVALKDKFSSIVGDQKYLRKKYNLDSKAIIKTITKVIRQ